MSHVVLFSGSSNKSLAEKVAAELSIPLGDVDLVRFADGEIRPWIKEDVRGKTVFILESLSTPMDDHMMELVLLGDAVARSAPKSIIAIIPYLGYARQDKQHRLGEPVSARVIAKMIEVSRFQEIVTVDLHNDAIVGFFEIPVIHVSALKILAQRISELPLGEAVVIAPDVGGVKRARNLALMLKLPLVVMEKNRKLDLKDTSEVYQIIGDVKGKTAILIDDMIATGGTTVHAAESLKDAGAKSVIALATHGVFAGDALKKMEHAPIEHIIVTDSIATVNHTHLTNLHRVSVAPLIAHAIKRIAGV